MVLPSSPIAAGVGVTGGRIGLEAFFLLGVEGPPSLPLPLVRGSAGSCGTPFLFLLILATLGGVDTFVRSSLTDEAALSRADLLEDIEKLRSRRMWFIGKLTAVGLKPKGSKAVVGRSF